MTTGEADGREPAHDARRLALVRIATGLVWGLAVSALLALKSEPWLAGHEVAYNAFSAIVGALPFVLLGGYGRLRPLTLLAWAAAAVVLAGLYGGYDQWRDPAGDLAVPDSVRHVLSFPFVLSAWAWLFIAHHQIEPADAERTWFPSYAGRFERAWRNLCQLLVSAAFALVVFGVLKLGGALFQLIGLPWLDRAVDNEWVYPGVLATAFAAAIHLTDVRPALIRSVRMLLLNLLSWALPLLTGLVVAFLCAMPFSRAQGLWHGWFPSSAMLFAGGVLIVLVNAAYQDGEKDRPPPAVLRWSARVAGLALVPLTALAAYGLGARIGQYGFSPDRIWAAAAVLISAIYALGYAWAALDRRSWMRRIAPVNMTAAGVILVLGLVLFSPVLDPARLGVADQMQRLQSGRVRPEAFDFLSLRFRDGRAGTVALQKLIRSPDPKIALRARAALAATNRYGEIAPEQIRPAFSGVTVHPAGAQLPESLRRQPWPADVGPDCFRSGVTCQAVIRDLTGDGRADVMVSSGYPDFIVLSEIDGRWAPIGRYAGSACSPTVEQMMSATPSTLPPLARDLLVNGLRIPFTADLKCPAVKATSKP